ncbi:reverse transcriptase zinc-binding domain-containing protein [Tanacetum coccineum]
MWLVTRKALKTHDKLHMWDLGGVDPTTITCVLCGTQADSHTRLFFECPYASKVWISIRHLAGMEHISPIMDDIVAYLIPMAHKRNVLSVIGKLIVAAGTYFIWRERNTRLFKNIKRPPEDVRDAIMVTVRLKLLTLRFKNKERVKTILARWNMPSNFKIYGDV